MPPPPLPKGEAEFSPKWTEIPPPLSKSHSWPRAGGDTPSYYSYQKRAAAQRVERSCQSAPLLEGGGAGMRSSLDPNSRPFTPACRWELVLVTQCREVPRFKKGMPVQD